MGLFIKIKSYCEQIVRKVNLFLYFGLLCNIWLFNRNVIIVALTFQVRVAAAEQSGRATVIFHAVLVVASRRKHSNLRFDLRPDGALCRANIGMPQIGRALVIALFLSRNHLQEV